MARQTSGPDGLVECPSCRRRVVEVFELTGEDIQRRYSPGEAGVFWRGCADCRDKFRSAARLEVRYGSGRMGRDVLLMTPAFFAVFYLLTRFWTGPVFLVSAVIFFTAIATVLRGVGGRYAFTHNLVWSLRDRSVIIGFSVMAAIALANVLPF